MSKTVASQFPEGLESQFHRVWWFVALDLIAFWVVCKKKIRKFFGLKAPKVNSMLYDGLSKYCRDVKDTATSWRALDIVYNMKPFAKPQNMSERLYNLYYGMENAQAVRNRRKIIAAEITDAIKRAGAAGHSKVRIMSVAAGSAQSVMEGIGSVPENVDKVLLLDIDPKAIEHAKNLAVESGIGAKFDGVAAHFKEYSNHAEPFRPHVVEVAGLLDYLPENVAVEFFRNIKKRLPRGGTLLTCNIAPNKEQYFLKHVINWGRMIYREESELRGILEQAGFSDIRIFPEPLQIHQIAVCTAE